MRNLNVTSQGGGTVTHELSETLVTIGRNVGNVIQLDDPSVSGQHAQLQLAGDDYQLTDLDSTNGTRVNGSVVKTVTLRAGDRVRFGKVEVAYVSDSNEAAQPLPTPQPVEAQVADVSARPADFANASPFPNRKAQRDSVRAALFALVAVAILAFIASMIALLQMQPPAP
jgi:pSer/pThr/pTyr-binding forkhead associated (FHA) protein